MSSMSVPPESSSAVLVMIRSKSVSICKHSRARLVDSSRNRTFSRGYLNLMPSYGGLLEPRRSKRTLLKSRFNAENLVLRLPWSISSDFGAVYSHNHFRGSRSFEVVDVGTSGKRISSTCYDKQQVCVYLQLFSVLTLDELIALK